MGDNREPAADPERLRPPKRPPAEEPVLPQVSNDEHDLGWGADQRSGERDDEWYLRERPPHHE